MILHAFKTTPTTTTTIIIIIIIIIIINEQVNQASNYLITQPANCT